MSFYFIFAQIHVLENINLFKLKFKHDTWHRILFPKILAISKLNQANKLLGLALIYHRPSYKGQPLTFTQNAWPNARCQKGL